MNVVHIITKPDGGGAELLVRELNNRLAEYDVNSQAIYFSNPNNIVLKDNEYCLNLSSPRSLLAISGLRYFLKQQLINKPNTIVHCHLTWSLYYVPIAALGLNCRLVYTEHSTHNKRREYKIFKYLEKIIYRNYYKIVCISNGTRDSLSNWLDKLCDDRLLVIYNGSRQFKVKSKINNRFDNRINLISIGSLSKHKGFNYSIQAISQLKLLIHKYYIIGDGPERNELQKLIHTLELNNKVVLVGWVDDIEPYLHKSDISLIPSLWEGFGLVAIEALSAGLPVIASNVPGLNEVLNDDLCPVILFQKGNINELVTAINTFIIKIHNGEQFHQSASFCASKYTLNAMTKNYAKLYNDLSIINKM